MTLLYAAMDVYAAAHYKTISDAYITMLWVLFAWCELQQLIVLIVYFVAIRAIARDAETHKLVVNKRTMKVNLGVGVLVIVSYTINNLGKSLIFASHSNEQIENEMVLWAQMASIISSFGFFSAFACLIWVFKNYAEVTI